MGFRYEDAASQWWEGWPLSAQAPSSNSFEMKRLTNEDTIETMSSLAA
jgi:hypothetical protein